MLKKLTNEERLSKEEQKNVKAKGVFSPIQCMAAAYKPCMTGSGGYYVEFYECALLEY